MSRSDGADNNDGMPQIQTTAGEVVSSAMAAALYSVVLAMASFERTRSWGALGLCGWGMAAKLKPAIAPGLKTSQLFFFMIWI